MRRDQLPPHKTATYVLPRWKVVYVSVPKAACTSLKWLIAELQEEKPERFYSAMTREVGRAMTIHRRQRWQQTPMLHDLADEELEAVSPEHGWYVFAAVRHPAARLWSAWQSKFLLQEPRWPERFANEEWFPRVPRTTQDVVEDFHRFVHAIAENPKQPVMTDRHFQPQHELLAPDRMPYTRIYDTGEIPNLLSDFAAHMQGEGWAGSLQLQPSNETPLRPLASMFTPGITAAIAEVYRDDFEQFRYENVMPPALEQGDEYGESALQEIGRLVQRAERVGDLALRAQRLYRVKQDQQAELRRLRRQVPRQSAGGRSKRRLVRRVRARIARALNRARRPSTRGSSPDQIRGWVMSSPTRLDLWVSFVNEAQARHVAEIGVYRGDFAARLLRDCQNISSYYMIDPWRHLEDWNKPANRSGNAFERFFQEAMDKTSNHADKRVVLRGKTSEVIDQVPDNQLDFAYIDGDHTLRGITVDLVNVFSKVRYGGWIGGDDFGQSIWQHGQVYEPTFVFPYAIYFAEAVDARIYALPHDQFLIEKVKGGGHEFIDLTGKYGKIDLRTHLEREGARELRASGVEHG